MINAAVVGLGRWGQILTRSVQGISEEIRITAGVARTPAKAEAFAKKHDFRLTDDLDAVISDPDIDAVIIATPHTGHFDPIMAAAAAGKHVFCEKPFTLDQDSTAKALTAIEDAGLKVGTGFNRRFAPNTIELKRMLKAGELGQRLHIEGNMSNDMALFADAWRAGREESPAGGMTSFGMHLVDTNIHLFGPIASVQAISKRQVMPYDVDDTTSVMLEFESGCTGYLSTVAASAALWQVRAYGDKGWGELRALDRLDYLMTDGTEDTLTYDGYAYPGEKSVCALLEAFARDVSGGPPFPIPPDEILHGVAVLEAIITSVASGERRAVSD